MLYCKSCQVAVAGIHQHCPLCGGHLSGQEEETPHLSQPSRKPGLDQAADPDHLWAALTAAIVCVAINMLAPHPGVVVPVRRAGPGLRLALGGGRRGEKASC